MSGHHPWRQVFDCPKGCVLVLNGPGWRNRYGEPYDGIACPTHRLYAGRRGRQKLWPKWKVTPPPRVRE